MTNIIVNTVKKQNIKTINLRLDKNVLGIFTIRYFYLLIENNLRN